MLQNLLEETLELLFPVGYLSSEMMSNVFLILWLLNYLC